MKKKQRLDQKVHERYPQESKTLIQSLIMRGKVKVNDTIITKAGFQVKEDDTLLVDFKEPEYVSRAGFKLEGGLEYFGVDPQGLVVMDAGLSTGGFTHCLLKRGAKKVYGIDVGYGQVHEKIRAHPDVVVMERTNLRHVESLPELVDLVTLDLSFISILKVINVVHKLLKGDGKLLTLIKPQFEARRDQIGKGGIIKDPAVHDEVVQKVIAGIEAAGFTLIGLTDSPILGTEGNKEFLGYFEKR